VLRIRKGVIPVHMENTRVLSSEFASERILRYWFPVLVCMAIIFCASSLPGRDIPKIAKFQDIVFHFLAYSIFSFFLSRAIKNANLKIGKFKLIVFTALLVTFYGVSDEFHQSFVPGRSVSGFDVFIDSLGGFFGSLVFKWRK